MAAGVIRVAYWRLGTFPQVTEREQHGLIASAFEEIRPALRITAINFLWRALAVYPEPFLAAWRQLAPNAACWQLERSAANLRPQAALDLSNPRLPQNRRLAARGYSRGAIHRIQRSLEAYTYVNPKLLVLCAALWDSLSGHPVIGAHGLREEGPPFPVCIPAEMPPLPRVAPEWAEPATVQTYAGNVAAHGWHDIASDFQTLAQWPQYLELAWGEVATMVRMPVHRERSLAVLAGARQAARRLPFPVTLAPEDLRQMGYSPERAAAFTGTVQLFLAFLPSLMVTTELFATALTGEQPAAASPYLARQA